jgi:hypothetical protein
MDVFVAQDVSLDFQKKLSLGTDLMFPSVETISRQLTGSHHGQPDETGPTRHPQTPVF